MIVVVEVTFTLDALALWLPSTPFVSWMKVTDAPDTKFDPLMVILWPELKVPLEHDDAPHITLLTVGT